MCGIPMPPRTVPDAVNGRKLSFEQALAHVGTLDDLISDHGRDLIKANAKQYLWKYPDKTTWCTACGKPIQGFSGHHGQRYACPRCGANAEFRYEAKGHGRVFDEFVLYEWRRSVIDPEAITLTASWVQRDSAHSREPHLAPLRINTTALYVFRLGKAVTVYKAESYWTPDGRGRRWVQVESIHPEHTKNGQMGGAHIVIDRLQFLEALAGTRIGRVFDALREASGQWEDLELTAIANCARRPWLEYLAKCGQAPLAGELMRMPHIPREIVPRQRARKPRELLGLTEGQWYEVRKSGILLDSQTLQSLRLLERLNIGPVKVGDARNIKAGDYYSVTDLLPEREMSRDISMGDMISRLPDKLRRKIIRRCLREPRHIREWSDYYKQLRELGEVSLEGPVPEGCRIDRRAFAPDADPALLLPKDVHAMHQRMTERLDLLRTERRIRETEALRAKFEGEILPKLMKHYRFEAEGLVLRPYTGAKEVIAEGSALSICIGSYAERYMEGRTVICCLRKAGEPDKPWRAVEFSAKTGELVQDRGYKNDIGQWAPPPEVKALLQRFWAAFDAAHKKRRLKTA